MSSVRVRGASKCTPVASFGRGAPPLHSTALFLRGTLPMFRLLERPCAGRASLAFARAAAASPERRRSPRNQRVHALPSTLRSPSNANQPADFALRVSLQAASFFACASTSSTSCSTPWYAAREILHPAPADALDAIWPQPQSVGLVGGGEPPSIAAGWDRTATVTVGVTGRRAARFRAAEAAREAARDALVGAPHQPMPTPFRHLHLPSRSGPLSGTRRGSRAGSTWTMR